ncbi:ATP-binding protein [Jeotgalibacillus haloalkalitolerans]|uniref:histidine kinase n=1 Tax=Jeotgalibacillus haloalkalitolerans TaxID=3104292 RepID=A0ABU5KRH7_9BACL|nr:ATP-binding protein [Jeotgalibacillus sp. HH7-29]MDZ5713325.1 ATP-binding protein [Jeotgalibacillus sp. HH7-29]
MRSKYLFIASGVFITVFLSFLIVGFFINQQQNQLLEEHQDIYERQEAASELADALNDVFFRARGVYAFQSALERERLADALNRYQDAVAEFSSLDLTSEEQLLINELTSFMEDYENNNLPAAIALAEAGDYEGLRELSQTGLNITVNDFVSYTKEVETESEQRLDEVSRESIENMLSSFIFSLAITGVLILILVIFMWKVIASIIKPIEKLHVAANDIREGRKPDIEKSERNDELGALTSSFIDMTAFLQHNEEELHAQNEELLAQQEAMHEQQDQLAATLLETQETKGRLELFNDLNRVLSSTSNRYKFLDDMVQYMNRLYAFDQIMMYMADHSAYSAINVSTEKIQQIVNGPFHQAEGGLRIRKRLARPEEDGLHTPKSYVYDLTAEITGASGELIGIFRANRFGRPFEETECKEIEGLVQRMSIAFQRLLAFDEIKYARELTQDMLDNMTEGLQLINQEKCMVQHNEALCRLLEVEPSEDEKIECAEWLARMLSRVNEEDELRTFLESAIESAFEGTRSIRYTLKSDHDHDHIKVFDVYGMSVYRDKEWTGTIFVHRDITKDYEVDRMKSELVSTVSHELRTPLSSVLGFAELLLTKEMKPEKQKRYIETIHKEAKRLTNLINDFLDLQRMESGKQEYHMEEIKLNELVMEVLEKVSIPSSHALILRDQMENSMIKGDRERLTQVMTNLLNNAVKFSPDGGDITVSLHADQSLASFVIEDQGIGIPENEVSKLFQKFKRIDNSESRKIGGTGLGLAICKEIVEKHMGHIFVTSEEGKGAAFHVELPLISENESHTMTGENTILVLEDDPSLALLIADELKSSGFSVVHHFQPERAVDAVANQTFTGVIVDLMLGDDLSGWDVIGQIRSQPENEHLPIIVSSALDADHEKIQQYNVTHYLTKPYPPEKISEVVKGL